MSTLKYSYNVLCTFFHSSTTTVLRPFFWDHPGEPVPEENLWTYGAKED